LHGGVSSFGNQETLFELLEFGQIELQRERLFRSVCARDKPAVAEAPVAGERPTVVDAPTNIPFVPLNVVLFKKISRGVMAWDRMPPGMRFDPTPGSI